MFITALFAILSVNAQAQVSQTVSAAFSKVKSSETRAHYRKDCVKNYKLQNRDLTETSSQYQYSQEIDSWKSIDGSTIMSIVRTLDTDGSVSRATSITELRVKTKEGNTQRTLLETGAYPVVEDEKVKDVSNFAEVIVESQNGNVTEEVSHVQILDDGIEKTMLPKGGLYTTTTTDMGNGNSLVVTTLKTAGDFGSAGDAREISSTLSCSIQKL